MINHKILALLFATSLFLPQVIEASSAGFLDEPIWFSESEVFADKRVRIYSGIVNSSEYDIRGEVQFFDGNEEIGNTTFFVERGGNFVRVWVDWVAEEGEHSISAAISQAFVNDSDQPIDEEILNNVTEKVIINVRIDTDGDGVADEDDEDDDDDGITDVQERAMGTDPLVWTSAPSVESAINAKEEKKKNEENYFTFSTPTSTSSGKTAGLINTINSSLIVLQRADDSVGEVFDAVALDLREKANEKQVNYQKDKLETEEEGKVRELLKRLLPLVLIAAAFILRLRLIIYFALLYLFYRLMRYLWRRNRGDELDDE